MGIKEEQENKDSTSTRIKSSSTKDVTDSSDQTISSKEKQKLLRGKLNFSLTPRETLEILSVLRQPTPVPPLRISSHPEHFEAVSQSSRSPREARLSKLHPGEATVDHWGHQKIQEKAWRDTGVKEIKDSGIKEWRDCEGKEWKESG